MKSIRYLLIVELFFLVEVSDTYFNENETNIKIRYNAFNKKYPIPFATLT